MAAASPETLSDPRNAIRSEDGAHLVVYCSRNHVGGVFSFDGMMWSLWTPIDVETFLQSLIARDIKMRDAAALQAWLDQLMQLPDGSARH